MAKDPNIVALSYKDFWFKFARKTIGATKVVLWEGSTDPFITLDIASNVSFSVISSSALDKSGSGGAVSIQFIYQMLDGIEKVSPVISLNGTDAVDIPTISGVISYRMYVIETESDNVLLGPNLGVIKLYQTGTPANIFAEIPVAEGQTLMGIYRVPSNKYAELVNLSLYADEGKGASIWARVRKNRTTENAWRTKATFQAFQGGTTLKRIYPGFIYPGSDIVLIAQGSAATTLVDANFEIRLYDL